MSYPDMGNSHDSPERVIVGVVLFLWLGAICSITFFALLGTVGFFIGLGIVLIGGLVIWRIGTDPAAWELVKWRFSLDKKATVLKDQGFRA